MANGVVSTDKTGGKTIIPSIVPAASGGWNDSIWKMNGEDSGIFDDVLRESA